MSLTTKLIRAFVLERDQSAFPKQSAVQSAIHHNWSLDSRSDQQQHAQSVVV